MTPRQRNGMFCAKSSKYDLIDKKRLIRLLKFALFFFKKRFFYLQSNTNFLIERGRGTGPMKPRQRIQLETVPNPASAKCLRDKKSSPFALHWHALFLFPRRGFFIFAKRRRLG